MLHVWQQASKLLLAFAGKLFLGELYGLHKMIWLRSFSGLVFYKHSSPISQKARETQPVPALDSIEPFERVG